MDEVFGSNHFLNEIVWYYRRWTAASNSFQKMHDTILLYSKTDSYTFNPVYIDATEGQKKKHERGYDRNSVFIDGVRKPQLLVYDQEKVDAAIANGTINIKEFARVVKVKETRTIAHDVWPIDTANSFIQVEIDQDVSGSASGDLWEINYINSQSTERTNYPTQKPQSLLERIIEASSNLGDVVFDCFMGSGTTQAVAMKLGRRFIGADINLGAIQTTTKRLISVAVDLESGNNQVDVEDSLLNDDENRKYTGFEVYNVNNYDFFRNPVEARDLLIEALEIQRFPQSDVWDGELDGRMVKIMPVNRIATKADLKELIANLPPHNVKRKSLTLKVFFLSQALGIPTDESRLWALIRIKCTQIAQERFEKHNVVTSGLQMPILCYGSEPPMSNRVYTLTSFVLPVHSLGVNNAYQRGQAPWRF